MLNLHPDLEDLIRRADPGVRALARVDAEAGADGKRRKDQFAGADSLTGLTLLDAGGVQLAGGLANIVAHASSNSVQTDLDGATPHFVALVTLGGTDPDDVEIRQVTAHLNPKDSGAVPKNVAKWKLELLAIAARTLNRPNTEPAPIPFFQLQPLCQPVLVDAVGTAAGDVTFDFTALPVRPRPKLVRTPLQPAQFFIRITALRADGSAASNVSWSRDTTIASTGAGNVLQGMRIEENKSPYLPGWVCESTAAMGGYTTNVPRCAVKVGSFANAVITFSQSGNRLNLGHTPTGDVELGGHALTPTGSSVTFQVLKDGGAAGTDADWRTYLPGQLTTEIADVGKRQHYEIRGKLNTNAGGTVTPTLIALEVREVLRTPIWDVAAVTAYQSGIDPLSLKGEIPEARLTAVRDGARDYEDVVTALLSTLDLATAVVRVWVGALSLSIDKWLHHDDWYIENPVYTAAAAELVLLSPLHLLRQALPIYSTESPAVPNATQSNPGSWTDEAGGSSNIYQSIDEDQRLDAAFNLAADDADYVQSPVDPANAAVEFALADIPDPVIATNHQVEYRYSKDAAGGKTIDLTVELRQGAAVISSLVHTDIAETWLFGTFELTAAQANAISDYADLRIRFSANVGGAGGSRRARVSWARFVVTGRRQPLEYANQSVQDVYDDLIGVQARDFPPRHRGQSPADDTTLVAKTIEESDLKDELNALLFVVGGGLTSRQGVVKPVDLFGPKAVVGFLPSAEIRMPRVSPGFDQRTPEVFLRYAHDQNQGRFRREARAFNASALTTLGRARIEPPVRIDDAVGEWVPDDAQLARRIVQRQAVALGPGVLLWSFTTIYAHPEWELGDMVAIQTDLFAVKAVPSGRAVRGDLWALAVIVAIRDVLGTVFTVWVRSHDDLLGALEAATRFGFSAPVLVFQEPLAGQPENVRIRLQAVEPRAAIYWVYLAGDAVVPPQATITPWTLYTIPFVLERDPSVGKKIAFFADDAGIRSPTQVEEVAPDKRPTIINLVGSQTGADPNLTVKFTGTFDADVREVEWYLRVGNWPTGDSSQGGTLSRTYFISKKPITALLSGVDAAGVVVPGATSEQIGGGGGVVDHPATVYCIAVPVDVDGNAGSRKEVSYATTGGTPASIQPVTHSVDTTGTSCAALRKIDIDSTPNGTVTDTYTARYFVTINGDREQIAQNDSPSSAPDLNAVEVPCYPNNAPGTGFLEIAYDFELWDGVPGASNLVESGVFGEENFKGVTCF